MTHVDPHARDMAETACLGVAESKREIRDLRSDIADIKRSNSRTQWIVGTIVTVIGTSTAAITQVQVAAIGARSQQSAEVGGEQAAQKKMDQLLAELQRERDALRVERERLERRRTDPDVVTLRHVDRRTTSD